MASATERARGLPEGTLRGVLELTRAFPPGVSLALFRRSEAQLAGSLSGETPRQLAGDLGRQVRVRGGRVLAGAVALGLAV
ncbi:MAG: hypothetical protein GWM90_11565, partial [Gemmatimonadetes bacterium]|nr:hypothetical protein [Gemmatimonadota bacterium]NIQ54624.1 hypothetical protein [Gemmatimonadota bacterium]NIU74828.1 hypothetical protein [Gammaproteobacteria bacterium]NIX44729.1 hypothetical protein [Gemmatimonadota bacterium]